MKWERIINNQRELTAIIDHMQHWQIKQPCLLTIKPKKRDRTDAQNAIFAVWARQRSEQTGLTESEERNYCKLTFGVPIMCHHDKFREFWQHYRSLSYEDQLKAMNFVDVTSLMSIDEMTRFLTELEIETHSQGLEISTPRIYEEAMQ